MCGLNSSLIPSPAQRPARGAVMLLSGSFSSLAGAHRRWHWVAPFKSDGAKRTVGSIRCGVEPTRVTSRLEPLTAGVQLSTLSSPPLWWSWHSRCSGCHCWPRLEWGALLPTHVVVSREWETNLCCSKPLKGWGCLLLRQTWVFNL